MSSPTDLLTAVITKAVRQVVREELATIVDKLDQPSPQHDPDELLTTPQVAAMTGISENTLRRWRSDDDPRAPKSVRMGGAVRYRRRDLDAWINQAA